MKENKEKDSKLGQTSQSTEGQQTAKPASAWKRFTTKKWAYPAIYLAAAAIIFTLMWVYQGSVNKTLTGEDLGLGVGKAGQETVQPGDADALPVNANLEEMKWPVGDSEELNTAMSYYDSNASQEEKAASIVQYNDTLTPHLGLDLYREDDASFDVLAALSGKVTVVENNSLAGNLVEIEHPDGLVTVYQSLNEVKVTVGQDVKQGDMIAKAGRNELEKDEGVHLHFEVRQGEDTLNPKTVLPSN